jgi:hypothetical protein
VESEGGIAKMAVHPLAERKEMSPKANRLPKAITIAREFIDCRSKIIWFTFILFLGRPNQSFFRARTSGKFPEKKVYFYCY